VEFSRSFILELGRYARGPTIALAALAAPLDGAHAGFFDFLFSPPPPTYYQSAPPAYPSGMGPRWRPHVIFHARRPKPVALHHPHKVIAEKTRHAKLAHTVAGLMDDDSLQNGDAVMTDRGIRIFTGDAGSHHALDDFVKLSDTKGVSKRMRAALAEIDANRSEGRGSAPRASNIMTGRSAADSDVSAGALITDPRGRVIRYVGP
jgi:hypothetical protein